MTATLYWFPERLNARLLLAAPEARRDFARLAQLKAPGKITVQVLGEAVGTLDPTAMFFEFGTPPHEIEPKKKVLRLADGRFVTGPVKHPGMRAKPFLRPTLPAWPQLYRRQAAQAFRGF
jgi:hypothetical protein